MQRLSGVLLIIVGVALAAYTGLRPLAGHPSTADFANFATEAAVAAPSARTGGIPRFAPDTVAFRGRNLMPASTVQRRDEAPRPWAAVVTAGAAGSSALRSSRPADFETRVEITRDLQRELQRVGCYGGKITGNWTPASRAAMAAFMDRVNAKLPVEEPDYILLTLVQGHAGIACGASCPRGQDMSPSQRCVPRAVLAQARRARHTAALRVAQNAGPKAVLSSPKRANLAASDRAAATPASVGPARAGTRVAVASVAGEKLPWLETVAAVATRAAERRDLPPGRMAIGGPTDPMPAPAHRPLTTQKLNWEPIPANDPDGMPGNVTTSIPKQVAMLADADQGSAQTAAAAEPPSVVPREKPRKARRKATRGKSSKYARRHHRPRYYADDGFRYRRAYYYASPIRYNLTLSTRGIF